MHVRTGFVYKFGVGNDSLVEVMMMMMMMTTMTIIMKMITKTYTIISISSSSNSNIIATLLHVVGLSECLKLTNNATEKVFYEMQHRQINPRLYLRTRIEVYTIRQCCLGDISDLAADSVDKFRTKIVRRLA